MNNLEKINNQVSELTEAIYEVADQKIRKSQINDAIQSVLTTLFDNESAEEIAETDDAIPVNLENNNPNEISFVVTKNILDYADYNCPTCNFSGKVSLRTFDRSQYRTHHCPNCNHKFLMKLDFELKIRNFLEQTGEI